MDERQLSEALNICIDRLAMGQSVEDCLRAYPEYADALRPLLYAGLASSRAEYSVQEVRAAKMRAQGRFEQALARPLLRSRPTRWPMAVATVAAAFILVFAGLAVAAQSALPGEPLWGLKRLTENVQLALSGGDFQRDQFAQRRIEEIALLLVRKQVASVTFEGTVEQISGEDWRIASLPVRVPQQVSDGQFTQVGDLVSVSGETTSDGLLIATMLVNLSRETLTPPPTAVPTLLPEPSPSSTPTSTLAPTFTATPTMTPTSSQTPTPNPTSTLLPSATPTQTPDICIPTRPAGWIAYAIRAGDTLSRLAAATGVSLQTLIEVNCIPDASLVVVGQVIYLPSSPTPLATAAPVGPGDNNENVSPPGGNDNQSASNDNQNDNHDDDNSNDNGGDSHGSNSGSGSSDSGGSDDD
ncbi:MAG: LysM peptidoglycan-binding domain-containing protein [Anaerolineae bacterium]|nr:LysM peptidoglycan-binding domain-containing protein [Anaerolineae bacterium]